MAVLLYEYPKCSTCRKAKAWFEQKGIAIESRHIIETPPSAEELAAIAEQSGRSVRKLFNTSGIAYREMGLKDKLDEMSEREMLELLASDGKLIRRPLATDGKRATAGFKEADMERVWG